MGVLKLLCLAVFGVLWGILWTVQDEEAHLVDSIGEGAFEMGESIVARGVLDEQGEAVYQVYADGDIALANELGEEIALSRDQAYALLEVLYRQRDRLRGREDTLPLQELPAWAQPEERHDHLCRCPGCNYDGPEPTEEEGGRIMREMGPDPTEEEQWQATGTCQIDEKHTGRDIFRCDGCQRMCCNHCGEVVDDLWLCEACILPKEPIMTYPF